MSARNVGVNLLSRRSTIILPMFLIVSSKSELEQYGFNRPLHFEPNRAKILSDLSLEFMRPFEHFRELRR